MCRPTELTLGPNNYLRLQRENQIPSRENGNVTAGQDRSPQCGSLLWRRGKHSHHRFPLAQQTATARGKPVTYVSHGNNSELRGIQLACVVIIQSDRNGDRRCNTGSKKPWLRQQTVAVAAEHCSVGTAARIASTATWAACWCWGGTTAIASAA